MPLASSRQRASKPYRTGASSVSTAVAACAHHWRIEMPCGPTSTGRCKLCGETREFKNSQDDYGIYGSYKECGLCGKSFPYTRRYFAIKNDRCQRCYKETAR